jgi:hypothetical protein
MSTSDWEEIRENVRNSFQDGEKEGKDSVEVTTGLLWFERQTNRSLCAALEEILRVARAPLDQRPASRKPANLVQMVIDPGTGRPSRHQVQCTPIRDGQSHTSHEIPAIKAAVENCPSDPGQYASRDKTKL